MDRQKLQRDVHQGRSGLSGLRFHPAQHGQEAGCTFTAPQVARVSQKFVLKSCSSSAQAGGRVAGKRCGERSVRPRCGRDADSWEQANTSCYSRKGQCLRTDPQIRLLLLTCDSSPPCYEFQSHIPELETLLSARVRAFLDWLQDNRAFSSIVHVLK